MQFVEEKSQYVKCLVLTKLKQCSLLLIGLALCILLGIAFAATKSYTDAIIVFVVALIAAVCISLSLFKQKQTAEKAWDSTFGDVTSFKLAIELVDEEIISVKREDTGNEVLKKLGDITKVIQFKSAVVIVFSDNTSFTFSKVNETDDFSRLLDITQIKNKAAAQKSPTNRLTVQISIATLILSVLITHIVSEAFILGSGALIQYSWVMYFFAIVPVVVLIISIINKNKKGMGVVIVVLFFISTLGSFRFIFNSSINYDTSAMIGLEQRLNYDLPDATRLITEGEFYYTKSVGKFTSEDAAKFENAIKTDSRWVNELNLDNAVKVSRSIAKDTENCDYFLIYNEKTNQYCGADDTKFLSWCIIMAYRSNTRSFVIIYDFNDYAMNV